MRNIPLSDSAQWGDTIASVAIIRLFRLTLEERNVQFIGTKPVPPFDTSLHDLAPNPLRDRLILSLCCRCDRFKITAGESHRHNAPLGCTLWKFGPSDFSRLLLLCQV